MTVPGLYEGVQLLAKSPNGEIVPWTAEGIQWANTSGVAYVARPGGRSSCGGVGRSGNARARKRLRHASLPLPY